MIFCQQFKRLILQLSEVFGKLFSSTANILKRTWLIVFLCCSLQPVWGQRVLTLDDALRIAEQNSPSLQQARLGLEQSEELLAAQNAALKSRFTLTLTPFSYDRSRDFNPLFSTFNTNETRSSSGVFSISQPIKSTDGTIALQNQLSWRDASSDFQDTRSRAYSNNLYLTYQQPLFTYNRTRLDTRGLELDRENARLNYQMQLLLLEQQVAQAFYDVFQQTRRLTIAEEEYQNTEKSFQIIQNKVEAGLAAKEEQYQAELNLTTSRSGLQNQRVLLANSQDNFKQLIGLSLDEEISTVANIVQDAVPVDLEKAVRSALDSRMELRQRKINIENSRANLTRTSATNEFRGDLNLTVGLFGNDEEFNRLYQQTTQSQNFSLSVQIPLFDWGEKDSRIRASQASLASSELSLDNERTQIMIGIRQAYRNLENQIIQIDIARQNVRIAELTYDINLERYQNGDLTSMDLNLFQNQLSEKKISELTALIGYRLALLDMKIKSLYDFEKDRPVLQE